MVKPGVRNWAAAVDADTGVGAAGLAAEAMRAAVVVTAAAAAASGIAAESPCGCLCCAPPEPLHGMATAGGTSPSQRDASSALATASASAGCSDLSSYTCREQEDISRQAGHTRGLDIHARAMRPPLREGYVWTFCYCPESRQRESQQLWNLLSCPCPCVCASVCVAEWLQMASALPSVSVSLCVCVPERVTAVRLVQRARMTPPTVAND